MAYNKDFIVKNGVQVLGSTQSTSTDSGALQVHGGAGIGGQVWAEQLRQTNEKVAIGSDAGSIDQGDSAIAVGANAGYTNQNVNAVAIGNSAGATSQGTGTVAIGMGAGNIIQGETAVAVGVNAGNDTQGEGAVAIGPAAADSTQGATAVAVGQAAGRIQQGIDAISVGHDAGYQEQGAGAVAIGLYAGNQYQGANAIAIGNSAGTDYQPAGSIIINATGSFLNAYNTGTYIAPIRTDATTSATTWSVYYNAVTKELTTASGYTTSTLVANAVSAITATSAAIAYSLANTGTTRVGFADTANALASSSTYRVADADTANNWLGGIVYNPVTFSNDVTFSGSATYINSTSTVYTDNIIEIHTPPGGMDAEWTVDDGKDIGFHLHYFKNGTDTNAALLLRNDSKYLEWFQSGTDSTSNGNNFTATTYGTFKTGSIILANTATSNSTDTGALTVAGGVGVGGDLWANQLRQTSNKVAIGDSAGNTQGQLSIAIGSGAGWQQGPSDIAIGSGAGGNSQNGNGIAIGSNAGLTQGSGSIAIGSGAGTAGQGASAIAIGTNANSSAVQPANSIVFNANWIDIKATNAGLYIAPIRADASTTATSYAIYYNSTTKELTTASISSVKSLSVTNSTVSTSPTTGALTVAGGAGIAGNLYVGGNFSATNIMLGGYSVSTATNFNGGTITDPLYVNNATASTSTTTGALTVAGGVGIQGDLFVGATGYVKGAEIVTTATFSETLGTALATVSFTATYITQNPALVPVPAVGTVTTYGTYNFGSLTDITTYGDYNTISQTGYYSVNDATGAPAHVEYIGFSNVTEFNRAVFNINYTTASGHTVDIDLYNYQTDGWDTFATYSGSGNWQQFALGLIDHIPYISAANSVTTRIYHVSSGNTAHRTWIDYVALEQSTTGGQGPRGATGATGATGAQGVNTGTTSTFIISDTTNSTSTTTGALQVAGGVGVGGNVYVGGNLYVSSGTVNILAYDPNILYVSSSIGNDTTGDGRRISSAYATIKKALSVSTSGNVINIAAGIYSEIFPLTVPQGVTIAGAGIRATTINPTVGTNTLTAVYLNGETTVNDLTISGFYKPGYAFQFATGANITTRSPYVQRVSVITRGSVTSGSDPYGFAQADAGNGAYLDASVLNAGSLEPAMLWNEVTFVVPNATGLYATNGARAELIDTFVYFADKAVNAVSGSTGFAGVGQTRLKLGTVTTGTFTAGDKIVYKSSTGTVITSGTIASVVGSYVYLNGPVWGFETAVNRTAKITTAYGTAALSTAQKKFGTSSLLLNGTTDFALVPTTTDFLFANSNLTIELWVYRAGGTGVNQVLLDFRTASTQVALALYLSTTYVPTLQVNGSAVIVGGAAVSLNTWTHIAVSKSGTSTKLFVNGTQSGSTYTDNNSYIQGPLSIGANYAQASWFNGYIDDLRVSNVARYTTTFTAPTSELTNDVSTLLMLHFNGSNGSTSISDDYLVLQNISSVGASPAAASSIVLADYHQFGAELRFIASAAHYGNTAVTANGTGTDIKLISYNMSYIGAGKDITDDASLTVQANEVIQLNNGKIYYQTIDQSGDFRVGSSFIVNQRTGNVNFGNAQVNLSSLNQLIITDGVNNTNIYPTYISVGDLVFSGDTIASQGGNLTINAGGGATTLNNNTLISGSATISGVTTVTNVTNSTSTTTGALTVAGGVGISGNLNVGGTVTVAQPIISDAAATAVGTNIVVLDSFAITKYRAAKYFISVNNTSTLQYQATEILLVQDGTNSSIEQTSVFATTDNIITFTSIIIGSIVYLRGIGTSANNTVKVQATYITV